MPAHTLPFTFADAASLVTAALYLYQPGVDRKAVMQWLTDNIFGSSMGFAIWGIFGFQKVLEWGTLLFYAALYKLEIPIFERHRTFPHKPWPWKSKDPKVVADYAALEKRSIIYTLKFHAVVFIITLLIGETVKTKTANGSFNPNLSFGVDTVPHWWTTTWQVFAGVFVADSSFYWGHRLLHHPWFYWAHKQHHEFKEATVWATFYVHPLDAIFTDILPAAVPVFLFNMHIYTVWMYSMPILLNVGWVHCGYEYPFRFNPLMFLPMATGSEQAHDIHHRCYRYNFGGAYFVWDRLMGTYVAPPSLNEDHAVALHRLATYGQVPILGAAEDGTTIETHTKVQ